MTVFTRMLDNVVEMNGLALASQREEITRKRRHGMGYLGLGSAITMLCMKYGDVDSVKFTEQVTFELTKAGYKAGLALAKEKGPAPIFDEMIEVDDVLLNKIKDRGLESYFGDVSIGDSVSAKELWINSVFMQKLFNEMKDGDSFRSELEKYGCRFTHATSIAPTGTIALSVGNNASNGIEPSFAHHYCRNVVQDDNGIKEQIDVFSYELLAYRAFVNPNAMPDATDEENKLPDYFVGADEISPREHIDVQAAAQHWVDSSISKTVNCATDIPFEDFEDVYLYAYNRGLKGCTTFRFNPEAHVGVLVRNEDLEKTKFRFQMEDGSEIEASGDEDIDYQGKIVKASNLYEALKEGRI